MNISDFIGQKIRDPIRSKAVGEVNKLWDVAHNYRERHQTLQTVDGRKRMSYTLLYYVPGLTTLCGIRGLPVITGYMSGCYLFRYRDNGVLRAAHVGTHDFNTEWSDKAKAAWKAVVAQPNVTDVFGYDPIRDVPLALVQRASVLGEAKVFGMWESNGAARVGVIAKHHDSSLTLVGIDAAPLRPWSSIEHDQKML